MATDPYAAFSDPVQPAAPQAADPYASFADPVQATSAQPSFTKMAPKDFNNELRTRIMAAKSPADADAIEQWASSIRRPETVDGKEVLLSYKVNRPQLEKAVAMFSAPGRRKPQTVTVTDVTEKNTGPGALVRGALDAPTFSFAPKIEAGIETGLGLFGDYEQALQENMAQRAMDDPNVRLLGQLGGSVLPLGLGSAAGTAARGIDRGFQALETFARAAPTTGGAVARGMLVSPATASLALARAPVAVAQGVGKGLQVADDFIRAAPSWYGRAGRTAVVGGAAGGLNELGMSAPTETFEETAANVAGGIGEGAVTGAVASPAVDLLAATGRGLRDLFSGNQAAITALESVGIDPAKALAAVEAREAALGRPVSLSEVIGPKNERLTGQLAVDPQFRETMQETALNQQREFLQGIQRRAPTGDVEAARVNLRDTVRTAVPADPAIAAEQSLQTGLQTRIGDTDFEAEAAERLRASLREQVAPLEAKSADVLDMERRLLDKENYGELASITVPVDKRDITKLNKFVAKVPFDSEDATQIRSLYNSGVISADSYDRIRRGLADLMQRSKYSKDIYSQRIKELDEIFGELLPEVAEARRASFEARSLVEGAQRGRQAIRDLGNEPGRVQQNLGVLTPERQAGVPIGGALAMRDLTSSSDKARRFADVVSTDIDYPNTLRRVFPPQVAEGLVSLSNAATRQFGDLKTLGLPTAAKDIKSAYDTANRILADKGYYAALERQLGRDKASDMRAFATEHKALVDGLRELDLDGVGDDLASAYKLAEKIENDPKYADKIRARLPDDKARLLTDFAIRQKQEIDSLLNLGLDKIGDDIGQSYAFAMQANTNPRFAQEVMDKYPDGRGQELLRYAAAAKQSIDSMGVLAGVPPQQVLGILQGAEEGIRAAFFGSAGGSAKAGFVNRFVERLGAGQGAAKKLADYLTNPESFDMALNQLKRRYGAQKVVQALRDGIILTAAAQNAERNPAESGVITTTQEEPQ